MKKNIMVLTVVVGLALASALYLNAMASTVLRVNVPFAFQVGKTALPAGTYIVEMERTGGVSPLGSGVLVRTPDGRIQVRVTTMPGNYGTKSAASVTFSRYGNFYYLSAVQAYGLGRQLYKSKAEKEVAAKLQSFQRALVAAE